MFKAIKKTSALVVCACLGTLLAVAHAETPKTITIPAGELNAALESLVEQTGMQLLYDVKQVEGLHTHGVHGARSPQAAVIALLKGTALTTKTDASGALLIAAPDTARSTEASVTQTADMPFRLAQAETNPNSTDHSENTKTQNTPSQENESLASSEDKDSKLEEIVVTAERREESAHSLPIAISAFSGETLTNRGIEGLDSLPQLAPSVQAVDMPGFDARVAVRGISNEISGTGNGGEPAAAMTLDGVSYATANLFAGDFFDIERIEVLRGPQGTISGRNATAGAIHVHSKRPTEELEGGVKATAGNYDRLGLEGYLSGPIVGDRLLARLAVHTDRADGWLTNTLLDQELNTIDTTRARASFLAHLTDDFEAHLILDGLQDRSTAFRQIYIDEGRLRPDTPTLTEALGIPGFDRDSNTVQLSHPSNFDKERYQATLKLAWNLGPSAKLTAVTGYVDHSVQFEHDNDATAAALIVHNEILRDTKQASQEVTLTTDLTDRLDMLLGAYYLHSDQSSLDDLSVPPVAVRVVQSVDQKLTSWAGYTQWRYRLTDQIRLTAGTRYTYDMKDFRLAGPLFIGNPPFLEIPRDDRGDDSWSAWTPRFAVDYAPNDDISLYGSVSRGFKSGGLQPRAVGEPPAPFQPEFVWNYEAGVKANWLDGRLKTAVTGFYMDYTDLQAVLTFFDQNAGTIRGEITNAKSATNKGVELEFDALITDQLLVTFGGTWLDASYDELRNHDTLFPELGEQGPGGLTLRDLSGNQVVRAPEWQFNVSGEYRVPVRGDVQGVLRASYAWQDKVFFDIFNRESTSQDPYGLINLSAGIEGADGRWQLSAFVHNLTDQKYDANKQAVIGLAPVPYAVARLGQPRRYGISLAYRF